MLHHHHIRVTQRDIDRGVQGHSFHCPVALAIKRALKASAVWVREVIIVTMGRSQQTYATSPEVQCFLESYDSAILEFEAPRPQTVQFHSRCAPVVRSQGGKAGRGCHGEVKLQTRPARKSKQAHGD